MGKIDKNHDEKRAFLRTVGPIILIVGIIFLIVGAVDFFGATSSPFMSAEPSKFWCFFVALPLLFIGGSMTSAGYMGAMARYNAEEMAPVGKDTFNYVAKEGSEGVQSIAKAIKDGVSSSVEDNQEGIICPECNTNNKNDAKFCNNCGSNLLNTCSKCGTENKPGANFCNDCGASLK